MTHLKIEQNITGIEQVTSAVISKLYNTAKDNYLDSSSSLVGRLHSAAVYVDEMNWLTQHFPELYITYDKTYIKFQDSNAQQWCVSRYSSDGVGCSPEDLTTATTIDSSDIYSSGIVYFNELQYFTNLTRVSMSALGNENTTLKQVTIPRNVQRIGKADGQYGGGFWGCTSLESVTILSQNVTLGQAVFRGCSSLQQISFSGSCSVGSQAFYDCTSLSNIDLTGVETIGSNVFMDCTSLTSINIPSTCTSIGNGFVSGSGVRSITFDQSDGEPLSILGGTSGYRPGTFRGIPSMKIVFPPRLSSLTNNALGSTSDMTYVFTSETPPTVTGTLTTAILNTKIYVPDAALNAYKTATGFSAFASSIYPVSELPS